MSKTSTGTILRGIFSCESPDRAGETVSIKGIDISSLLSGKGIANSEHSNSFAKAVGKVISAKKIYKEEDCANTYERGLFESVAGAPILIGEIELFDKQGHEEAAAIARVAKYYKDKDIAFPGGFSVQGGILHRDGSTITKSIVRQIAVTMIPANEAAPAELANELTKSERTVYDRLVKTPKAEDVLCTGTITEVIDVENATNDFLENVKERLQHLTKALEAGFATGAPGTLTQGAALQKQRWSLPKAQLKKPKEETEETGLKPVDKEKATKIDDKKEDAKLSFKLKKAEYIAYSFYNSLKK